MKRRSGFTMIEVLVVIGIMIILISIVVVGFKSIMGGSKKAATKVTLDNLRSMITEFEIATKGLSRQPSAPVFENGASAGPIDIWHDAGAAPGNQPVAAPKDVTRDIADSGTPPRYNADAIHNTQLAFAVLQTAANNKKAIAALPGTQLMEKVPVGVTTNLVLADPATNRTPAPPLITDAWGNPIIFVPGSGLWDVYAGGVHRLVAPSVVGANDGPIRSRDNRPFWASAGPDGSFGGFIDKNGNNTYDANIDVDLGDDNIYSFEN